MPTIYTQRNYVIVGKALAEDRYLAIFLHREDGRSFLTTLPIDRLSATVEWAIEMADFMSGPIDILPIPSEDDLMRKIAVAIGFEGVHAQTDPDLQRQGRELLAKLGVAL